MKLFSLVIRPARNKEIARIIRLNLFDMIMYGYKKQCNLQNLSLDSSHHLQLNDTKIVTKIFMHAQRSLTLVMEFFLLRRIMT
jgi:hypothetical protein